MENKAKKILYEFGNREIEQFVSVKYDSEKNEYVLERDFLGIVPLFYKETNDKVEYSLKKKEGFIELKPNTKLLIIPQKEKLFERRLERLELKGLNENTEEIVKKTKELIDKAIDKRLELVRKKRPNFKMGILFSGGVDSTYLAYQLKKRNIPFIGYNASVDFEDDKIKESEDYIWAQKVSEKLGFNTKFIRVKLSDVEEGIKELAKIIDTTNHVKISIALPFYFASKVAYKDGITDMVTGLGSEEIFAGYERHVQAKDINKECIRGLEFLYDRDLYRDFSVLNYFNISAFLPLLDLNLVRYTINIPPELKIKDDIKKYIFRVVAEKEGIPKEFAFRKKRAAQYGSNFNKAIQKLAKRNGFKYMQEYIDWLVEKNDN